MMIGVVVADASLPVLYTFRRCPYAMRARLAIAASGQPVEQREIMLRSKPLELLAASPKGTVPILVFAGGEVIDESLDIMLWALGRSDPQGWLAPVAGSKQDMLALIAENDGAFKQSLDRYKYANRYARESAGEPAGDATVFSVAHRTRCANWLAGMEGRLSDGWLFGARASLADMALLPFVRQFAHTDASWFAARSWPRLQAWLAGFEASALYQGVMAKRSTWHSPVA